MKDVTVLKTVDLNPKIINFAKVWVWSDEQFG